MAIKIIGWVLLLGTAGFFLGKFIKHKSLYPFLPFRHDFRKRRDSFRLVMALMDRIKARVIVETGTSREGLKGAKSNGAATIVFGTWAKANNAHVHSVDISPKSIANAEKEVIRQDLADYVSLHTSDSIAFLKTFNESVDLLYLDSYDYSDDPEVQLKSQEHHLGEFKAIEAKLHDNTLVLIDDCDLPNGGKGKLVIAYMKERGWKIIYEGYQVLLVRDSFSY
ncbi:class I SAM-dependent methyltransferase [Lentiprolixibacter aurantiacus]|uniref:Class I SAM-dependent methyltransferase n=1 Tax=Lentiprolixibacter aurantiacus TaxID=2993939 RepID=A0AAE3MN34_9FLAO|nr:class I SAM-dependent methyltransferase [Lentiprolixibacter aurantiacus]MCX2720469.1 class I SAM-dependent methyltransferase [Lentiprolixibacter aurantiacus]